jgi:hypothetical protein
MIRALLTLVALAAFIFATLIGFGHFPTRLEDLFGWLALGLATQAATALPLDDWAAQRTRRP